MHLYLGSSTIPTDVVVLAGQRGLRAERLLSVAISEISLPAPSQKGYVLANEQ
jgi:hypothetical protein